jgi:transcriptional regulator GlxA family with amidase domain
MSYLVEKLWGFDIAQKVSRNFLMDFPRQNTQFNLALNDQKQHKDERILAAQSWIESHFSSEFLMEELADKVGLSLRNLSRRFKNSTGNTPNQYLQKVRIEIAKDLLKTTEMSVDQITYRVGYVDVSSFCKLFKKVTQQTPSEYRAENNL